MAVTPETPKIEMELLDELTVAEALQDLKEEVKRGLYENQDAILEYCLNHNVDFYRDWQELDFEKEEETGHFHVGLSLMGEAGEKLFAALKTGDEDAKNILGKLVEILRERQNQKMEVESKLDTLSTDVESGVLHSTLEHIQTRFEDNPLAGVLAGAVVVWIGAKLWNMDVFKTEENKEGIPIFQYLAKAGAGALAVNYLVGPAFGGKSLFEHTLDLTGMGPEEIEDMMDTVEDRGDIELDRRAFRTLLSMGQVPFKYALKAYERDRNKGTIDMERLRRDIPYRYRKSLSRSVFNKSLGRGLFQEMERMVGAYPSKHEDAPERNLEAWKERYVTSPAGAWSTLDVLMDQYLKNPDFAAEADEAAGGGGGASRGGAAGGAGAGAAERKIEEDSGKSADLSKAKGFEALGVVVEKPKDGKGYLYIKGYRFEYTLDESKKESEGVVSYKIKVGPTSTLTLEVGESADQTLQATLAQTLESHVKTELDKALQKAGLPAGTVIEWKSKEKEWVIPSYLPTKDLGHAPSPREVKVTLTPRNDVRFDGLQLLPDLDRKILKEQVARNLASFIEFSAVTSQLPIVITKVPDIQSTAKGADRKGEGTVGGGTFTFESVADASGAHERYKITSIDITAGFAAQKRARAEGSSDFVSLFDRLRSSGPRLSELRGDNTNHYWNRLLDFKRKQLLDDYEAAVLATKGSSTPVEDLQAVEADSIEIPLYNMRDWPSRFATLSEDEVYRQMLRFDNRSDTFNTFQDAFLGFVDAYDVEGMDAKNAEFKQEFNFKVLELWHDKTRAFADLDPADFTPTKNDYFNWLQGKFKEVMDRALLEKTGSLEKADKVITKAEFAALIPELQALSDYGHWLSIEGRDEGIEAAIPSIVGFNKAYTFEKTPGKDAGVITFPTEKVSGSPVRWMVEYDAASKKIDITAMEMTPGMIDAQVLYATAHQNFNKPFDDLYHIFDGMESRSLKDWSGLDFERGFRGPLMQNKWQSLIDYKRSEAKADYRRDLTNIMQAPIDPVNGPFKSEADRVAAWHHMDTDFGNKYVRDFTMYADALNEEIITMTKKTPRETFTEARFDDIYMAAQGIGYNSLDYRFYMSRLRSDAGKFDYRGSESLGSQNPWDVMNKVIELQHKYTGFMSDIPQGHLTDQHRAYLRYVHKEVMRVVFKADEHGEALRTGTFVDKVIGADEIPVDLSILSFEDFMARPEFLNDPDYTVDVDGLRLKCKEEEEDPVGKPCDPEYVDQLFDKAQALVAPVYKAHWDDPIMEKTVDEKLREDADVISQTAKIVAGAAVEDIVKIPHRDPTKRQKEEEAILDRLADDLDELLDQATCWKKIPNPIPFWGPFKVG